MTARLIATSFIAAGVLLLAATPFAWWLGYRRGPREKRARLAYFVQAGAHFTMFLLIVMETRLSGFIVPEDRALTSSWAWTMVIVGFALIVATAISWRVSGTRQR